MQRSWGACLCCSPPQGFVLQSHGTPEGFALGVESAGQHGPLRAAALESLQGANLWDDSCSLWFGSSGDAGWKISHLWLACDAALALHVPHPCVLLPREGGVSSPRVGWGLLLHPSTTHRFTSTGPEVMPLLPTPSCSHVAHCCGHWCTESCGPPGLPL